MNILLINTNPVVSRLIALCLRDEDSALEEVNDISRAKREKYDIVFVDDLSYVDEVERVLEKLIVKNKVYLSSERTADTMIEDFDDVIKKPFLPSQIISVIERVKNLNEVLEEPSDESPEEVSDVAFIFPLSSDKQEDETKEENIELENDKEVLDEEVEEELESIRDASVLDSNEIEKIKALLNDDQDEEIDLLNIQEDYEARKVEVITEHLEADGLEIISEDDIVDLLSNKSKVKDKKSNKEQKKNKKKQKKKKKKSDKESYSFEEALIAAIEGMKIKKIKKLLKDKDVNIRITIKDK